MADLDDKLDRLISDQESMRKVLEMAKTILAQRNSAASASAADIPTATETSPQMPDLSALLSNILGQQEAQPSSDTAASLEPPFSPQGMPALAVILPQIMQAVSGQGDLVKQERVTLLRAMRPYLKDNRLSSIDRALRMANVTKAATAALHTLGR